MFIQLLVEDQPTSVVVLVYVNKSGKAADQDEVLSCLAAVMWFSCLCMNTWWCVEWFHRNGLHLSGYRYHRRQYTLEWLLLPSMSNLDSSVRRILGHFCILNSRSNLHKTSIAMRSHIELGAERLDLMLCSHRQSYTVPGMTKKSRNDGNKYNLLFEFLFFAHHSNVVVMWTWYHPRAIYVWSILSATDCWNLLYNDCMF